MQGTLWKASIVDKCTVMRDKKTADFQGHMSLPQQQFNLQSGKTFYIRRIIFSKKILLRFGLTLLFVQSWKVGKIHHFPPRNANGFSTGNRRSWTFAIPASGHACNSAHTRCAFALPQQALTPSQGINASRVGWLGAPVLIQEQFCVLRSNGNQLRTPHYGWLTDACPFRCRACAQFFSVLLLSKLEIV